MKENKYDNALFFGAYNEMPRSKEGLSSAGEWPALQALLPDVHGLRVLDLGCGLGWHCRYAAENGASKVVGVDLSEKMLAKAAQMTTDEKIEYCRGAIEDVRFADASFDLVLSSLALHYVAEINPLIRGIYRMLSPGGWLVFSCEHPVFTAAGGQDWLYNEAGEKVCWPVDRYFEAGLRDTCFLGHRVQKYHRTLTAHLDAVLSAGFVISAVQEPVPTAEALAEIPDMRDELRRPMMLIVKAQKP